MTDRTTIGGDVSISEALGELRRVDTDLGTIEYRERGTGSPVVFLHGVGVNGDLWRRVAPALADHRRCIVPDLPFGAHRIPLPDGIDMSLPGLAAIVAGLLDALELEDVTIVANDTGGAVAQALVTRHPERIGRLVITSCDAFDKYPPTPQRYLLLVARVRALMWFVAWSVRFRLVQRLPTAYGWTTRAAIEPSVMRSYTEPVRDVPGVRRDLARLLRAVDTRDTYAAAGALPGFDRPALVLWAEDDRLFPIEHGWLLAALLPRGRFATISSSRTFIPEDQPEALTRAIRLFLDERVSL